MRILIADDDISILQLVSIHLIREGIGWNGLVMHSKH